MAPTAISAVIPLLASFSPLIVPIGMVAGAVAANVFGAKQVVAEDK